MTITLLISTAIAVISAAASLYARLKTELKLAEALGSINVLRQDQQSLHAKIAQLSQQLQDAEKRYELTVANHENVEKSLRAQLRAARDESIAIARACEPYIPRDVLHSLRDRFLAFNGVWSENTTPVERPSGKR